MLGCDGAAVATAVVDEAQHFQRGDEVYFCNESLSGHLGDCADLAIVEQLLIHSGAGNIGCIWRVYAADRCAGL